MGFNNYLTTKNGQLTATQVESPNFVHGSTGWSIQKNGNAEFNSGTFRGTITAGEFDGTDFIINSSGAFFYSGAPAHGNLIVSIAPLSGTDSFTNAYPQGINVTTGTISGTSITGGTISGSSISGGTISGTTITGTAFDGTDFIINTSGAFFYSSTPATGNLIASIAPTSGTDAFSNPYMAGITDYVNSGGSAGLVTQLFNGIITFFDQQSADPITHNAALGHIHQTPAGTTPVAFFDGPSTDSGGLHPSIWMIGKGTGASNARVLLWNGTSSSTYRTINAGSLQFATVSGGLALAQNQLQLGASNEFEFDHDLLYGLNGSTTNLVRLSQDASGYPNMTDASGWQQNFSGFRPNSVNNANVTNANLANLGFRTVPAGDVEAGACFTIFASGFFTTGNPAPSSATFTTFWGGIAGTSIDAIIAPSLNASITNASWFVRSTIDWISTTEAAVTMELGWHTAGGVGNSGVFFTGADTTGLSTTGSENLALGFQWGSAPGGQSLVTEVVRIGRVC